MIGQEVIEVRVRPRRMSAFCRVTDETVTVGDWVLVDIGDERECGRVIRGPFAEAELETLDEEFHKVYRKATAEDLETLRKNQKLEGDAFEVARQKIAERELPMKLVAVDVLFDRSRIKFYFSAEGRVDFRELVRDLAHVYKTRIEMRQIGVRDEAKLTGGFGICGLTLCCNTWIRRFMPITIKMAKEQNLSLNPQKISGACGRLLCCLSYEFETYKGEKQCFPKLGSTIATPRGPGEVKQINIIKGTVSVQIGDTPYEIRLSDLKKCEGPCRANESAEAPVPSSAEEPG